jgi:hypothetical protein
VDGGMPSNSDRILEVKGKFWGAAKFTFHLNPAKILIVLKAKFWYIIDNRMFA